MRTLSKILIILFAVVIFGCETVHDGTSAVGSAVGKGADALGGITEGARDGYTDARTNDENPYER